MEQEFPMEGGLLTCRERNGTVEVVMAVKPLDQGLYHGYLVGADGTCHLGTLLPERDGLGLRRTLSAAQLRRQGCWPILGGQLQKTYSFDRKPTGGQGPAGGWREVTDLAGLFPSDSLLSRAAGQRNRALIRRQGEGGGFSLAFPWSPQYPFPMVPLFCFARVEPLNGRLHVLFHFRGNGAPTLERK